MSSAAFPVRLSNQLLTAIGGPGRRIPDIRRIADLQLLERLTAAYPAAGAADGWCLRFGRELNATEDRKHFGRGRVAGDRRQAPGSVHRRRERLLPRECQRASHAIFCPDERFSLPRLGYRDVSGVAESTLAHRRRPPGRRRHHAHRVLPAHAASGTSAAFPLRRSQLVCRQRARSPADGRTRHDEPGRAVAGAVVAR